MANYDKEIDLYALEAKKIYKTNKKRGIISCIVTAIYLAIVSWIIWLIKINLSS